MENNQERAVPDESQIEAMLGEIKPQPTYRFYHRMRSAPWEKIASTDKLRAPKAWKFTARYAWGLTVLVILLMLLSLAFIPSVRAFARQVIFSFIFEPTNQLELQVTLTNPAELFNYSDPHNFTSGIAKVQQQAGFSVRELSNLPPGLNLVGGRFEPTYYAVTLLYEGPDYQIFLTQRPQGHGEDVFSIGSDAQVQSVMVGDFPGEYVAGGWKAISTEEVSTQVSPTSTVNISAVWDEHLPQATLRWQADGYVYELRSLGEGNPSQDELINLAIGLQ